MDIQNNLVNGVHDFIYECAPERWIDGVPLGNGYLGAMLWGNGSPLRISFDKYDICETREIRPDLAKFNYENIKKLVGEKKFSEINQIIGTKPDGPREKHPYPTRLPLPRMEIFGAGSMEGKLCLASATWESSNWRAFVHAKRKLFILQGLEPNNAAIKVFHVNKDDTGISEDIRKMQKQWGWAKDCMEGWGYPPLEQGNTDNVFWARQKFPAGGEYLIAWAFRKDMLQVTVVTHHDADEPLKKALEILNTEDDFTTLYEEHCHWWTQFWSRSAIELPDKRLENLYYAEMYKLGSCTKPDGYAMSLCGLWLQEGTMPFCRGDYTIDLNVQQAYWPIYASNRLELGYSLYHDFINLLPLFRRNCREYYGVDGICAPGALGFGGSWTMMPGAGSNPGWAPMLCMLPSMLAWIAHNFWLHYKYSGDRDFLREKALPMIKESWQVYNHVLEQEEDGKLHLPICFSPEYGECTPEVWQKDSSFDAALIRFLCLALTEASQVLNIDDPDIVRYKEILEKLYDYPGKDEFWMAADVPLRHSHRHPTQLMGVHPLDIVTIEDSPEIRQRIEKSLTTIWRKGTGEWCGHAFSQAALLAARTGHAEMAWNMLQQYFCLIGPNSLVKHGDKRKFGITSFTEPELTHVDAGFGVATAIMEMLLQSWHGIIRVFPATPEFWGNVSFCNLLAEGAVTVSAEKKNGSVCRIVLTPKFTGPVKVKNVFNGPALVDGEEMDAEILEISGIAEKTIWIVPECQVFGDKDCKAGTRVDGEHWFGLKKIPRF